VDVRLVWLVCASAADDPTGPAWGIARVVRGGGLDYREAKENGDKLYPAALPYFARAANRASMAPLFESLHGNIGFRLVEAAMQATPPLPYDAPFFPDCVKQTSADFTRGPDMSKPYYHVQRLFPSIGKLDMRTVGRHVGFAPGLGIMYHNTAVQVLRMAIWWRLTSIRPRLKMIRIRAYFPCGCAMGRTSGTCRNPGRISRTRLRRRRFLDDDGRLWFFFGSPVWWRAALPVHAVDR